MGTRFFPCSILLFALFKKARHASHYRITRFRAFPRYDWFIRLLPPPPKIISNPVLLTEKPPLQPLLSDQTILERWFNLWLEREFALFFLHAVAIRAVFPSHGGDSRCFSFTGWRFALSSWLQYQLKCGIAGKSASAHLCYFKKTNIFFDILWKSYKNWYCRHFSRMQILHLIWWEFFLTWNGFFFNRSLMLILQLWCFYKKTVHKEDE